MKTFILTTVLFFSLVSFSQIQIGNDIDGKQAGDQLGWSTAISNDGTIVAVGASGVSSNKGYVQVFKNENGAWVQQGNDIIGDNIGDFFGHAISLSDDGNILAISAYGFNSSSGLVKIYKFQDNSWSQIGSTILGENIALNLTGTPQPSLEFGYSLDINSDGTVLIVGAPKAKLDLHSTLDRINCGVVGIYKFENNNWDLKQEIFGEAEEDNSGNAISLNSDGTILAIGASKNDGEGNNSGHVRMYKFENNNWIIYGDDINGEAAYDLSGFSVSLSKNGNRVAIGAPTNDGNNGNNTDSGHVRLYEEGVSSINKWFTSWDDYDGEASVDQFGYSVSLSNDGYILAAGSIDNDGNGDKSGHVRIFTNYVRSEQVGININGEASGDQSGFSICLSGDGNRIIIGAPFNDGNGSNSGHVRVFDLSAVLNTQNFLQDDFKIYPNPTSKILNIQLNNSILEKVTIYNNLGQKILSKKLSEINIENFKSGIYTVEVITNKGKSSKKIIIN